MICPGCGRQYPSEAGFCNECGIALPVPESRPKGRHWPPILIMVLMFIFGTTVYFMTPKDVPVSCFSVVDGVLYFDESRYDGPSELEIPASVDGQTVTALADGCFRYCDDLTTVTLPDTLESIGENCFYDCEGLRGIKLPEGLGSIGSGAFFSCGSLEAVYVPDSVESIGQEAFYGCGRLRYLFFGGKESEWTELYPEKINKICKIYPVDGSADRGENLPQE